MKSIGILLVLLPFLYTCNDTELGYGMEREETKETLFFVVAAHGNLRKEGEKKIRAMLRSVPKEKELYILKESSRHEACLFLRRTMIGVDTLVLDKTQTFTHNLAQAVSFLACMRPANISLIIFSHATGWYPTQEIKTRSIIVDKGIGISLSELYQAINKLRYKTIVFEACNMGSIECLYQFHDICDFIVASSTEMLSPGFLPLYEQGTTDLFEKKDVLSFAQAYAQYVKKLPTPYNSCAFAVYQTKYANELFRCLEKINKSPKINIDISKVQRLYRDKEEKYYDLQSFCMHSSLSADWKKELHQALQKNVIYKCNTSNFLLQHGGFAIEDYCGLSVFDFLSPSSYLSAYKAERWARLFFSSIAEEGNYMAR